jgi:hypothetical protein
MEVKNKRTGILRASLLLIQIFNGISGVVGGFMLIRDPSGTGLRMPLSWLEGTPFSDYMIPGIVLLVANGLGNLAGTLFTLMKSKYAGRIAAFFGAFMMIWIISQVSWIGYRSGLQPLYFVTGLFQLFLGSWKIRKESLDHS